MRKSLIFIAIFVLSLPVFSQRWISITGNGPAPAKVNLISSDIKTSVVEFNLDGFALKPVNTPEGRAFIPFLEGATPLLSKGDPDLPKLSASLLIPGNAKMEIEVVDAAYKDFPNILIAPSKGNLSRSVNPADITYIFGPSYTSNAFFPGNLHDTRTPYIIRDFRGQPMLANVFQYNPVTKVLRVYYHLTLKMKANGISEENVIPQERNVTAVDREFHSMYSRHFLNYDQTRYDPLGEVGKMLIISHANFMNAMQPFINWKVSAGMPVTMVDVATIGNAQAIKSFIAAQYAEHGISFVLLVGDHQQVPCYQANAGYSDNTYSYIVGNDHYPDLLVGRFSAENVEQVQTQVNKVLYYEINPDQTSDWMATAMGIASDQGPGDDNEMDYEHIRNQLTVLDGFTYENFYEYFDGSQGGLDAAGDPSPSQVATGINAGAGCIVYTGHGSQTSWGSSGFSNSNVNQLTNTGKLPFIFSVACVNGDFTNGTCFAEAWMRAQNNGQLRGAVATLMSTINQSWNPPMEGQDEMIAILTESYANNIKRTFGGISMNGCMKMNDTYGSGGTEMTDTWNLFGDPSLMVRTAPAPQITATHPATVFLGFNALQVSCSVEGALACVTLNGSILGTAYVQGGTATVNFIQPLSVIDTLKLVITAFNHVPYIATIQIIAASGPFMMMSSYQVMDPTGNNNNLPDFSETISLDMTLQNLGVALANGVTANLSTTSTQVSITDNTQGYGDVNASAVASQAGAYAMTIASNVPDQTVVPFTLAITDLNSNTWNSNFNMVLNAPSLKTGTLLVDDATGGNNNGNLDPGETVNVIIPVQNIGHSDAPNTLGSLATTNSLLTLNSTASNLNTIIINGVVNAVFSITVSPTATLGSSVDLNFNAASGAYTTQKTFFIPVGIVDEDFESNTFTQFNWVNTSSVPWIITTVNPFEGQYCARSGAIPHNTLTELKITFDVLTDDSISFYRKVSSEQDYDFLQFFIDNNKKQEWSGEGGWQRFAYPVTAGNHTFRWVYEKDFMATGGSDAAWIDYVVFPPVSMTVGLEEPVLATSGIRIYPNPANDQLQLDYYLSANNEARITLTDVSGRQVRVIESGLQSAGMHTQMIPASDLNPGIYFLNLKTETQNLTEKVIISH